jgi:Golgi nucleoside diphosphatase
VASASPDQPATPKGQTKKKTKKLFCPLGGVLFGMHLVDILMKENKKFQILSFSLCLFFIFLLSLFIHISMFLCKFHSIQEKRREREREREFPIFVSQ